MIQTQDSSPRAAAHALLPVERHAAGGAQRSLDCVAEECAIAFVYNRLPYAVMMASPEDLDDFALGFSLCEGILRDRSQLRDVQVVKAADGIVLQMTVANSAFQVLKQRRRNLNGLSGCGLCGTETLHEALRELPPVPPRRAPTAHAINRAMSQLQRSQHLHALTGAVHAAALCSAEGDVVLLREDIGRHNALDKLVGAMQRFCVQDDESFVVVSSRASYELVQKCCSAGIGTLVAISAPTTLAIDRARRLGLNLIGFARQGRHVVYHKA